MSAEYVVDLGVDAAGAQKPDELGADAIEALVAADPELEWTNPSDSPPTRYANHRWISWHGKPSFIYGAPLLSWNDPSPDAIVKLLRIAQALGCSASDGNGDRIELRKKLFGGEKVFVVG